MPAEQGFGPLKALGLALGAFGGAIGGWIAYSALAIDHAVPIEPAIDALRKVHESSQVGTLSFYVDDTATGAGRPLLLIHSINAAGNSYEMKPLFDYYRGKRPVYALDLPGFGFSERSDRVYSIALYKNAIIEFAETVIGRPVDVVALSLGSEFSARAVLERPDLFTSLALLAPTGFTLRENKGRGQRASENDTTDQAYRFVSNPIWSQALYDLLATKPVIRFFLQQSFYGEPDAGLIEYAWKACHQPGARYAPLYFVGGKLFDPQIFEDVYAKLDLPVMALWNESGFVTFDRIEEMVAARPNWCSQRTPEAGDLPQFEQLTLVTAALDEFWAGNNLSHG